MSENEISTDANPGRLPGVPPMIPGGEGQSVAGWIGFGAVALLWAPLWFAGVLDLPTKFAAFAIGLGVIASVFCGFIRWVGHPRIGWASLACVAVATLIWSLAADLSDGPDDPWALRYPLYMFGAMAINVPATLLWLYLLRRHVQAAGSQDGRDSAA